MKHPVYVKYDMWPTKNGISWTVLFSHGNRKEREGGLAPTREDCDLAVRRQIDTFFATVDEGTELRFHRAS